MLAGHTVDEDGRLWTLYLRDGLKFHGDLPGLARDALASIKRWAQRDAFGASLLAVTDEMLAPDDKTVPVMPERLALTPPNQAITEMIGSSA